MGVTKHMTFLGNFGTGTTKDDVIQLGLSGRVDCVIFFVLLQHHGVQRNVNEFGAC